FDNELHDAVANVTIAEGPANVPGIGVIPAGGEGRRRLNLDRVRVQGLAADARWQLAAGLAFTVRYLLDDTEVLRAAVAPNLQGLQLAQVPRQSATAGLSWRRGHWTFAPSLRWTGAQFEDDQNTLRLAPARVFDVAAGYTLRAGAEIFASAENLFDERIETGRSADGLVNTGTPRLLLVGVRLSR
ncbi:MAG TPA: TonB-dependent receptor, partial [Opitutus sp.]|nr:TonB-dependent receptor [Opitutus sp.]